LLAGFEVDEAAADGRRSALRNHHPCEKSAKTKIDQRMLFIEDLWSSKP